MTVKEIFKEMKDFAKANATNNGEFAYYLSGSKKKMTELKKLVNKFEEDSDLDFELGIINGTEHFTEMVMVKIMNHSIELANIY